MAIKKATIVLEGGATRGIFTSGVLDCLMEKEIYMSDVIGVSAGACNALDYVSRQPGRTRDCMIPDEQYGKYIYGIRDTIRTKSMMNMDLIFDRFPNELIPFDFDTYFSSPMNCELPDRKGRIYVRRGRSGQTDENLPGVEQYAASDSDRKY